MIRLGVVSDSHQSRIWTERFLAVANREGYDAVYFLGDGEGEARWLKRRLDMPLWNVAGNCDVYSQQARMAVAGYEGHTILAVHGHLQDVKYGYDRLCDYAEENGADIALFGHTHRAFTGYAGGVMLINPGALMDGCYAELVLDGRRAVPYLKNLKDERGTDRAIR